VPFAGGLNAAIGPELVYLLDTDVAIDLQHNYVPAVTWFSPLAEPPTVPGLVVMELVQSARNKQEEKEALKLIATSPVVWPTEDDCNYALRLFTTYHLSHNLGLIDALIASCAIGLSATLYTFNVKHYRAVQALVTAQPYAK